MFYNSYQTEFQQLLHIYSLLRSLIVHNFIVYVVGLYRMHAPTARICSEIASKSAVVLSKQHSDLH